MRRAIAILLAISALCTLGLGLVGWFEQPRFSMCPPKSDEPWQIDSNRGWLIVTHYEIEEGAQPTRKPGRRRSGDSWWVVRRSTMQTTSSTSTRVLGWVTSETHTVHRVTEWEVHCLPPTLLLGAYPLLSLVRWVVRRRRFDPLACRNCGYNLTGNTSGRCPECGAEVPAAAATPSGPAPSG